MPFVTANNIDIYYELGGRGPRLLFISGTGGDLRNKPNVFASPLAGSFQVLSYDQRGLGQTDKPADDYSMADYADDAAHLLDELGWGAVPIMGVSFGGMVAQELALRYPDKVSRLVLACTSSGGAGGASFPLQDLADLDPLARMERRLALADNRRTDEWRAANPDRWEMLLDMARKAQRPDIDLEGAARQIQARAGHDTWDRLPSIDTPTLVVGGEFDEIAPPDNLRALQSQIRVSELHFFAGGHLFLIQDKTAYPYIIQWLKESL
ncbi:MAG: alpha/beta fold hydrolase [Gammaproteobacteria bacterium]|nr:alpha/beta fold hydrolase [Gammaproteobacteria bacterium]